MAVTIAADGTIIPPSTLVFKGKPGGRIEKKEFSTYPNDHFYKCQDNAWMDEEVMIAWVKDVLAPYVATAPDHVVPILILDMYRCHMMSSVVQMIQELGVEVQHIPGGCTSLCQPVDVGFNKPFKDWMQKQWMSWMMNEGVVHGTTCFVFQMRLAAVKGRDFFVPGARAATTRAGAALSAATTRAGAALSATTEFAIAPSDDMVRGCE